VDQSALDRESQDWATAFEEAGLDVETPERSETVDVAPGSVAQVLDEDTGAIVFVPLTGPADDEDERGLAATAVNVGLRLGGGRLLRVLGRKGGSAAARRWEASRRPEELRWFRHHDVGRGAASAMDADGLRSLTSGCSLLWLHDILGRCDTDFAALGPDLHEELTDHYEGRIWAYEHHTLHLDPAANAERLVAELRALGQPVELDVVGYGRGGLVARELAERTPNDLVRVRTLSAVGTPHLGTPLADQSGLLAWVNRLTNLAALAPDPASDLMAALAAVLAHAVEGTVNALVGFTALGAGPSTYLQGLDGLEGRSRAPYLFVGGDHQIDPSDGMWSAIKRWAANGLLDDQPNDLLVSVDSALARRRAESTDRRADTAFVAASAHGAYFGVAEVRRALREWLVDGAIAPPTPPKPVTADSGSTVAAAVPAVEPRVPTVPSTHERPRLQTPPAETAAATSRPLAPDDQRADGRPAPPSLHVRLLHASLEHAQYPVLVGHFAGSPLSGAEERLDDCLENRLSRAQVARDYPEALGEFRHFPGYEGTPPPGAIVVGLGPVGDLTESQLTAVVTRSLVRYASEERDRERASVRHHDGRADTQATGLGLASVLIGTSRSSGLTVEGSVRAIVAGVVAANLRLGQAPMPTARTHGGPRAAAVAFTELRFVARHEDMVELAARAIQQLSYDQGRGPDAYPIHYVAPPTTGEGAAGPNPPDDTANDVWARVRIEDSGPSADGLGELTFAVMSRLARADEVKHAIDQALVDDLIAKSISRRSDPRIGATLYELLVPHDLKQPLGTGSHLHLLLDEHTADHPWELLTPRGDAFRDSRPVALGGGLLRQFLESHSRRRAPERAPERTVLVIGNPPPGPGFPSLYGAVTEAKEVVDAFERAATMVPWQVTARIWDTRERYVGSAMGDQLTTDPAENIVHELMTGSWRVVHIAAHGSIDPGGNAALSGVVLGPGQWLTPATVGQLSVVPDLVVLNACHLGAIGRQLAGMNRVAASLARRLMQIGVRAVIAAGWAVGDAAAAVFADALYSALLAGRELGDAVLEARLRVHDYLPRSLTWGAYQCYGDPGFRLAPRHHRLPSGGHAALTVSELRRRIRAAAGMVSDRTSSLQALRRDIAEVALQAAENPEDDGDFVRELEVFEADPLYTDAKPEVQADIAADLAVAWAELGEFERAVAHYHSAVGGGGKEVPLAAVERLVNLQVRVARQSGDVAEQRRLLGDAERSLRALESLGETAERMALWGSFYKKRACMSDPPDYDDVAEAVRCYREALRLDRPRPKRYHELNARQLTAILRRVRPGALAQSEDDEIEAARADGASTSGSASTPTDFWGRSAQGDLLLTALVERATVGQPAEATVDELTEEYINAFRLRSSASNRRSVIEHLEDVAMLLPADLPLRPELSAAAAQLRVDWLPRATPPDATTGDAQPA
jgi:tetratricopeptide (TPR) repeat protein